MLPKIMHPIFELTLPISNQTVKFRPFLVKEQSILLTTIDSDTKFIVDNIIHIIKNCCLSSIDIDELSVVDLEYFFIQLRAKSVGEIIEKGYICRNTIDDKSCGNSMYVDVDLNGITVDISDYKDIIMLTDKIGMKMKYPNKESLTAELNFDDIILFKSLIISCIDYIFDDDNVYKMKDVSQGERENFIDSLSLSNYKDIKKFFQNLPVLKKEINFVCNKCGYNHNLSLKGMSDFLG